MHGKGSGLRPRQNFSLRLHWGHKQVIHRVDEHGAGSGRCGARDALERQRVTGLQCFPGGARRACLGDGCR